MKATITFNLPEEQEEHADALQGTLWKSAVSDIDQHMRNLLKYDSPLKDAPDAVQHLRTTLHEILEAKGLSF
jgi:hypothetical protein